jgi:hypothetical protein
LLVFFQRLAAGLDQALDLLRVLTERHDRRWQPDQYKRAGIANASLDAIIELSPMGRRCAKFVGNKVHCPSIAERHGFSDPLNTL